MVIKWPWSRATNHVEQLRDLLGNQNNADTFLGIREIIAPDQKQLTSDAAKLVRYSNADDYKIFADEVWSRVIAHLDVMMDEKASKERVDFHRGAAKEALDLLRLSHQARTLLKADADREQSVTAGR